MLPGEVGTRAAMRLDDVYNTDMSRDKYCRLPWQASASSSGRKLSTSSTT
jgi:hypothetical protein